MELDQTRFHGGIILELSHMNYMERMLLEARKAKRLLRKIDRRLTKSVSVGAGLLTIRVQKMSKVRQLVLSRMSGFS